MMTLNTIHYILLQTGQHPWCLNLLRCFSLVTGMMEFIDPLHVLSKPLRQTPPSEYFPTFGKLRVRFYFTFYEKTPIVEGKPLTYMMLGQPNNEPTVTFIYKNA
jgi:hypothetical protein